VPEGERSQPLGERDLPAVVQVLPAQEDHLVVEQGLADPGDRVVARRHAGVDAGDLGADVAGQREHVDVRGRGEGFGHDGTPFSSGKTHGEVSSGESCSMESRDARSLVAR
jgi:hypothetical protein